MCRGWLSPPLSYGSSAIQPSSMLGSPYRTWATETGERKSLHGITQQNSGPRPRKCTHSAKLVRMIPILPQRRLGHVALPTCLETGNVMGKYLASFCHGLHLSYPNTHLTLPHNCGKHSCSLQMRP